MFEAFLRTAQPESDGVWRVESVGPLSRHVGRVAPQNNGAQDVQGCEGVGFDQGWQVAGNLHSEEKSCRKTEWFYLAGMG